MAQPEGPTTYQEYLKQFVRKVEYGGPITPADFGTGTEPSHSDTSARVREGYVRTVVRRTPDGSRVLGGEITIEPFDSDRPAIIQKFGENYVPEGGSLGTVRRIIKAGGDLGVHRRLRIQR